MRRGCCGSVGSLWCSQSRLNPGFFSDPGPESCALRKLEEERSMGPRRISRTIICLKTTQHFVPKNVVTPQLSLCTANWMRLMLLLLKTMNATVQWVTSHVSSLFKSLFTAEEKGLLLFVVIILRYVISPLLCSLHRPAFTTHHSSERHANNL